MEEVGSRENRPSDSASSEDFGVSAPQITLPKGGGAIQGRGEKFAANPVTGTGSMSVPIATSPGRAGFGPELSLSYDSGAGNGIFGFGWNLSMPSITRKTNKGLPRYQDGFASDVFVLSGAEDLVQKTNHDGIHETIDSNDGVYQIQRYRPRIEGLFARIERWTSNDNGDVHWRSISKDNILTIYGKDTNSRITDPDNPTHIFSWLICETRDDKGNAIVYQYKSEDGVNVDIAELHQRNRGDLNDIRRKANRYLKHILYGNEQSLLVNGQRPRFIEDISGNDPKWMFEVVFDYGEHDSNTPKPNDTGEWRHRKDAFSSYRAGFELRTSRLCRRVLMFHHFSGEAGVGDNCLVRSTDFSYSHQQESENQKRNSAIYTFLTKISQSSYKKKQGRDASEFLKRNLPPVEFEYSLPVIQDSVEEIDSASLDNLPFGVDDAAYRWTDLHGEGIPGILTEQADSWWYKRNISPVSEHLVEFTPLEIVANRPNLPLASGARFMDLDGNGQLDLVTLDGPVSGYYEHDEAESWQAFKPFTSRLNRNFQDPNLRFLDLDGDGHPDVLISENDAFVWHASLASSGYGPARRVAQALDEEVGPRLLLADGTQSIFLADLSGDGLTDLLRIRNGEVCYWPNKGYCQFGAKVSMDNAPHFDHPDQFEHSRIRLADIDGSGTTDIIYLHGDGVRVYFNESGNSWSQARRLKVQPKVDEIVNIAATDLLGNGTACLVWSSPLPGDSHHRMRYVNLMGAQKPHLLVKTKNNLGAETEMSYRPSTQFYLADKADGKPWITKLLFPVHVVEETVVTDKWRGTRFATRYSYHHGYFDGVEREFRGFGRVEQIDVETYGAFADHNAASPYIADDQTLYQPPVKTVSWFHTGVAAGREQILSQFQQEYFQFSDDFEENKLPEADLRQDDLSADEWREAMRACKGLPLRQEVYELDVDALAQDEHKPVRLFSTDFHNCNIQMLQPQGDNRHAVFLVTESEAISYQYDLDLQAESPTPDPRIAHTFNLNIDEYGNVLQSVAVVYPRIEQHVDALLEDDSNALIQQVQGEMHLAYNEVHLTNDVDETGGADSALNNYRLRLPGEALTYELTGLQPTESHFKFNDLLALRLSEKYQNNGIEPRNLAYHQIPDRIRFEKRIVEQVRVLYFNANLIAPLGLGELNSLGLPFETYKLALTSELLTAVFADKLTPDVLADLDTANKSGYQKDGDQYWIRSGIAGYANDAAEHFFLPEKYTDPFDNITTLNYDLRDLFIKSSTDPIGNSVSVEVFDYRVLAPREIKDINGNHTEAVFDVLGLPAAVAVKGKLQGSDWQGDDLDDFTDTLLHPAHEAVVNFCTNSIQDDEQARLWLNRATSRFVYHFGETIDESGEVVWGTRMPGACSILREQHSGQLAAGEISPLQIALECSDGGGNGLMQKNQAEPDPDTDQPRWVINGLTILNNKGKPVKQYEPAFTDKFGCEVPQQNGVTPILYYDAAGRLIRTELPDGSYNRVEFSPWHVTSFDANDTLLEADNSWFAHNSSAEVSVGQNRAAQEAAIHANTPTTVYLDSLGRDVISIEHNKFHNNNDELIDEKYLTFTKLDAEGKPLWIQDDRGNRVMEYIIKNPIGDPAGEFTSCYDISGNLLCQHSMDGGDRWMITDAVGQPFIAWDESENNAGVLEQRRYQTLYDPLRRPLTLQLHIDNNSGKVIERFVYGDGEGQTNDKANNLRGQLIKQFDSSGLISNLQFDFNGNLQVLERQLAQFSTESIIDWPEEPPPAMLDEKYLQTTTYDALGRMLEHKNWHLEGREPAIYTPEYNLRGLLISETLTLRDQVTPAIKNIQYDAKGQRQKIRYGNDTETSYKYDDQTFRLLHLKTSNSVDGKILQDLHYSYDPIGNITEIRDDAYEPVFFKNQQVEPRSRYRYDSLYRLIRASGRENINAPPNAPKAGKLADVVAKAFPIGEQALRNYTQHYHYDSVGNIERMEHKAGQGSWTRNYAYAEDSNRLLKTWQGDDEQDAIVYQYDTHGSMLNLNNTADEFKLHWDQNDMIQHINLGGGGDAFYHYGSDKERSSKRIVKDNSVTERIYLGGMERYRHWENGVLKEEIETHHLFDGEQRLLMVEDVFKGGSTNLPDNTTLFKYQYSNHLGSVGLELDDGGKIISYEEYHPYGTTAFSGSGKGIKATKKRYRYTGMERDEESGLSYHSARYYLPWLGRWGSVDPAGIDGGLNLYEYTQSDPISLIDDSGTSPKKRRRSKPKRKIGDIKSHNRQGSANYNSSGGRIDESEHIIPKRSKEAITYDKTTGQSDYTQQRYDRDTTIVNERNTALNKTHGNRGGSNADNPRSGRLMSRAKAGQPISYSNERYEALENMNRARSATGSNLTDSDVNRTFLQQDAEMFESQSLRDSGRKASEFDERSPSKKRSKTKIKGGKWIERGYMIYNLSNGEIPSLEDLNPIQNIVAVESTADIPAALARDVWDNSPGPIAVLVVEKGSQVLPGLVSILRSKGRSIAEPYPGWTEEKIAEGRNPFCAVCHDSDSPYFTGVKRNASGRLPSSFLNPNVNLGNFSAVNKQELANYINSLK